MMPGQDIYTSKKPEYYKPYHFYIGARVNLCEFHFQITSADVYALRYMELHCDQVSLELTMNNRTENFKIYFWPFSSLRPASNSSWRNSGNSWNPFTTNSSRNILLRAPTADPKLYSTSTWGEPFDHLSWTITLICLLKIRHSHVTERLCANILEMKLLSMKWSPSHVTIHPTRRRNDTVESI